MTASIIQDEALNLPAEQRVRLIEALWDSLGSVETCLREKAWATESERRIDAFENGTLKARSADHVFSELRNRLNR